MKGYRELNVWQKSLDLVDQIYDVTSHFPKEEKYGLISQLKRSCVSLPSNIAEGSQRKGTKEFINFIYIAKGSLAEIETQLIIAKRRGFISEEIFSTLMEQADQIDKMLFGLQNSLQRKIA